MKNNVSRSVFWGLVLVIAAVLLILEGVGVPLGAGMTPLRIVAGVLLLAWVVYDLVKARFARIFFPLAFLFIVFKPVIAAAAGREDLISDWVVLLAALFLTVGVKLLIPGKDKSLPSNGRRLGNSSVYLDANDPQTCNVCDNLGNIVVYTVNREKYAGNGIVRVHDNLGDITLHLPADWRVNANTHDNLGYVFIPVQPNPGDKSIALEIYDNLGRVTVVFD